MRTKYLCLLACTAFVLGGCNSGGDSSPADTTSSLFNQGNSIHITKWEANNGSVLANSDSSSALNIAGNFSLTWTNTGSDSNGYHADVLLSKDDKPSSDDSTLVGRNCGMAMGSNECSSSSGQLNCSYDSGTNMLQCSGALITDVKANVKTLLGANATTQPAYLIVRAASALALVSDNQYDYKAIKVQFR